MTKLSYEAQDKIPEGLREFAKEVDGKWVVEIAPKVKLDEFRDNNIKLSQERDELKTSNDKLASIVGEDPEAFQAELTDLRDTKTKVEDGKLKGSDAVAKEVATRLESMKSGFEDQLKEAGKKLAEALEFGNKFQGLYTQTRLDATMTEAVLNKDSGLNPSALPDILSRAKNLFTVAADGQVVPMKDGTVVYGADGVTAMTPLEWAKKLREEAPHFSLDSTGGDAGDADANKARGGLSQEDWGKLKGSDKLKMARANGV